MTGNNFAITLRRKGLSSIELLVSVSIIGMLVGLLLPAVQAARERSRNNQCSNNLKQLGLAINAFHNSFGRLPSSEPLTGAGSSSEHSWLIFATPFLEQQGLYDRYNFRKPWNDEANRTVGSLRINNIECPSTANPERLDFHSPNSTEAIGAVSDYGALNGVDSRLVTSGLVQRGGEGAMPKKAQPTMGHILDGISNTILLVESAGRPQVWQRGVAFEVPPATRVHGGAWASPATDLSLIGASKDGKTVPGPFAINATNGEAFGSVYPHPIYQTNGTGQFYSFHPGKLNVVLADGSVRSLAEEIDIRVLGQWVTRAGRETIQPLEKK